MAKTPIENPEAFALYTRIGEALQSQGPVVLGQRFGMPSLKANGKAFAGYYQDRMVFKLKGDAHATALGLAGSVLFDPSGMKRPMKEWVVVSWDHSSRWEELARAAFQALPA